MGAHRGRGSAPPPQETQTYHSALERLDGVDKDIDRLHVQVVGRLLRDRPTGKCQKNGKRQKNSKRQKDCKRQKNGKQ